MSRFPRPPSDLSEADQRRAVLAEAMSWLGTPYHHKARVKGAGVDCAQILIAVYAACGVIPAFDPGDYPPDWMLHREEERYLGWVQRFAVEVEQPQPGDVVLYRVGRCYAHGGIVVAWPTILHAFRREGVVLADGTQGFLAERAATFWSVWGAR